MVTARGPKVFFPWERRRGIRSLFGLARARPVLGFALAALGCVVVASRERAASEVRMTRATLDLTIRAVNAYRADHDMACPRGLADLVAGGYMRELPRDAWGTPLRLACPGRREPQGFDISSDGPDGEPGGLDRVQ